MPPQTPLPFINVKSAVRVGITNVDIQNVEKPLGSNKVSFGYASSGKMISECQVMAQNSEYGVGDVVSVIVNRLSNKPDFLKSKQSGSSLRVVEFSAKTEKFKEPKQLQKKVNEFNNGQNILESM
jgi:hypothetical protein